MKKILFIILLLAVVKVYSQDIPLDVIYFKDGTRIMGVITELIPGSTVKITDRNGKDLSFSMSVVERIEKENFNRDDYLNRPKRDSIYYATKKFTNITKVGLVRNISDYKNNVTFSNVFSYQVNELSFGIGGSYIKYASGYTVPVFIDAKYTFLFQKIKPYFYIDLGYSVSDEKGKGIYFQTGTGVRFNIKNNIDLVFDAAYSYQKVDFNVSSYRIVEYRDNLHITTGVQF
ncbi:MAG: hypothetical protein J0M18_14695 [Ignavibacteria bacterium]|nr:hypothetical protein [Ignavibacteria bacterium]